MSVVRIPCPNCRKELKVKDPALFGKKAKCPGCEHKFILQPPKTEEIPIEQTGTPQVILEEEKQLSGSQPDLEAPAEGAVPVIATAPQGGLGRLHELQRRNRQRRNRTLIGFIVFAGLLGGGYYFVRPQLPAGPTPDPVADARDTTTAAAPIVHVSRPVAPPPDWFDTLSPTDGEPITLKMVPSGTRLVINLRPAQLWSNDARMAELRASLTEDVTGWLQSELKRVCRHEPHQIEEVMLAWILGARGSEPELTTVVRLVQEARMSDLLDQFGSEALNELAQRKVYIKDDYATLILDTKTFAITPRANGAELSEWIETPNYNTSDGIAQLLPLTDRQRLVTVVFEPADLQRHLEMLVPEEARPVMSRIADWFGTQAETVAWSLHTGDEFHSEILLRAPQIASASTAEQGFLKQFKELPPTMVSLVKKMQPQRTGFRKIIGRFPAMLEVSRQATITSLEGKAVRLLTIMPPKAAPNLALGTVLTWDEASRTDFSAEAPPVVVAMTPKLPETLLGRLQLPVDAEFNRVPLQEALDYIAGEMQVSVEIDGDALKDAGFTKNMAQTFTLGKVPAAEALAHIVGQYNEPGKQMVVVLDEPRMTLVVLTRKFADQQGLKVHEFAF